MRLTLQFKWSPEEHNGSRDFEVVRIPRRQYFLPQGTFPESLIWLLCITQHQA
jgi:hypothetical protein